MRDSLSIFLLSSSSSSSSAALLFYVSNLMIKGIAIDAGDNNGDTALMAAAGKGRMEILQKLLEAGADKNIKVMMVFTLLE